jgi:hypothetical protein
MPFPEVSIWLVRRTVEELCGESARVFGRLLKVILALIALRVTALGVEVVSDIIINNVEVDL